MLVAINQRVNARVVGSKPEAGVAVEAAVPRLKMLMNIGLCIMFILVV